ncbi:hypothetical protein G6O67_003381 [Ophiocordyceps sinensis]|uniref:Uncharacterized protein n=1 Tax=Ophiocordyceps sinensis TaxID=72228 RepID=A0A8H4PW63_9HYPO|nr:hypothetical protein G6O67_003381 [Ophiocordyceps sinensis]
MAARLDVNMELDPTQAPSPPQSDSTIRVEDTRCPLFFHDEETDAYAMDLELPWHGEAAQRMAELMAAGRFDDAIRTEDLKCPFFTKFRENHAGGSASNCESDEAQEMDMDMENVPSGRVDDDLSGATDPALEECLAKLKALWRVHQQGEQSDDFDAASQTPLDSIWRGMSRQEMGNLGVYFAGKCLAHANALDSSHVAAPADQRDPGQDEDIQRQWGLVVCIFKAAAVAYLVATVVEPSERSVSLLQQAAQAEKMAYDYMGALRSVTWDDMNWVADQADLRRPHAFILARSVFQALEHWTWPLHGRGPQELVEALAMARYVIETEGGRHGIRIRHGLDAFDHVTLELGGPNLLSLVHAWSNLHVEECRALFETELAPWR